MRQKGLFIREIATELGFKSEVPIFRALKAIGYKPDKGILDQINKRRIQKRNDSWNKLRKDSERWTAWKKKISQTRLQQSAYSEELKDEIVKKYVEGYSPKFLTEQYHISSSTMSYWAKQKENKKPPSSPWEYYKFNPKALENRNNKLRKSIRLLRGKDILSYQLEQRIPPIQDSFMQFSREELFDFLGTMIITDGCLSRDKKRDYPFITYCDASSKMHELFVSLMEKVYAVKPTSFMIPTVTKCYNTVYARRAIEPIWRELKTFRISDLLNARTSVREYAIQLAMSCDGGVSLSLGHTWHARILLGCYNVKYIVEWKKLFETLGFNMHFGYRQKGIEKHLADLQSFSHMDVLKYYRIGFVNRVQILQSNRFNGWEKNQLLDFSCYIIKKYSATNVVDVLKELNGPEDRTSMMQLKANVEKYIVTTKPVTNIAT